MKWNHNVAGLVCGLLLGSTVNLAALQLVTFSAADCPHGAATTEFRAVGQNGHTLITPKAFTAPTDTVSIDFDLLAQPYTVSAVTTINGQTFYASQHVTGTGAPVPSPTPSVTPTPLPTPTVTPTPTVPPSQQSPNCTKATTVTMPDGVWSLGPNGEIWRNGTWAAPGTISLYKVVNGSLYVFGGHWFLFGTQTALPDEPACNTGTPTPIPTPSAIDLTPVLVKLDQIIGLFKPPTPTPVPTASCIFSTVNSASVFIKCTRADLPTAVLNGAAKVIK